ncbi:SPFH domain-containing protein [Streptomyces sp. NPDC048324]|uniref:SPFH domain-containing protein n=1 Tax=Streptomyces sp. NPDC048324 TaxID=3157205 RepID=UPI00341A1DEF
MPGPSFRTIGSGLLAGASVALAAAGLIKSVQVIPEGSSAVVERFGKYKRTIGAGPHLVPPLVDTIRNRIDLREQTVLIPIRLVTPQEGMDLPLTATVWFQVADEHRATYGCASYIMSLDQYLRFSVSVAIRRMTVQDARASLSGVSSDVERQLAEVAPQWGLQVRRVLLRPGGLPDEARGAVEDQEDLPIAVENMQLFINSVIGTTSQTSHTEGDNVAEFNIKNQHNTGQTNMGDSVNAIQGSEYTPKIAAPLVAELIRQIQEEAQRGNPGADQALDAAQSLRVEIEAAERENRPPDRGRARRWLAVIATALGSVATETAALAVLQQLQQMF